MWETYFILFSVASASGIARTSRRHFLLGDNNLLMISPGMYIRMTAYGACAFERFIGSEWVTFSSLISELQQLVLCLGCPKADDPLPCIKNEIRVRYSPCQRPLLHQLALDSLRQRTTHPTLPRPFSFPQVGAVSWILSLDINRIDQLLLLSLSKVHHKVFPLLHPSFSPSPMSGDNPQTSEFARAILKVLKAGKR